MSISNYCVLDIEVAPESREDEQITQYLITKKTGGLHPLFSKIILIGLKELDAEPLIYHGEDEHKILSQTWEHLAELQKRLKRFSIITFNGYRFDVPFLLIRSAINAVEKTININTNRWTMEDSNHFDLMQLLSGYGEYPFVSLEISCRKLGISVPESAISATEIASRYHKGDWDSILEHSRRNLLLTEALYHKLFGRLATKSQRERIYKLTENLKLDSKMMAEYLKLAFGKSSSKELTPNEADELIALLEKTKSATDFEAVYKKLKGGKPERLHPSAKPI